MSCLRYERGVRPFNVVTVNVDTFADVADLSDRGYLKLHDSPCMGRME